MARYVTLGPKASFFRDSTFDISIAPGEQVALNAMQLNSRKIRRALQGGHLIFVDKVSDKKEEKPQYTVEELVEAFGQLAETSDPKKRIASKFTLDQLKAIAPTFDIEVEEGDTKATIIDALLEAYETAE